MNVNYKEAARRHLRDGHILQAKGCTANAGLLFGFTVECGQKAVLVACGVLTDTNGNIPLGHRFRAHEPQLSSRVAVDGHLIPDGRHANYFAMLGSVGLMSDWKIEHRYYSEGALPLASVANWELVALEALDMIERAELDGIL
ncbi:MAG: hypothetical protein PHU46_04835 [Rhodocyclaceae bacterium]|nr:hypothetical protein [Rhodocyclaceae bacterium]